MYHDFLHKFKNFASGIFIPSPKISTGFGTEFQPKHLGISRFYMMNNRSNIQAPVPVQHQESEGFVTGIVSKGFRWKCCVILSIHFLFFLKRFHAAIKQILTHARFAQDPKTQREALSRQFKKYFGSLGLCVSPSIFSVFRLWLRLRRPMFLRVCLFLMIGVFGTFTSHAQNSDSRYFYAIELLDTGEIVRRGVTTQAGIPSSGQLILAPNTDYRYWLYEVDTGYNGSASFTSAPSGRPTTIPEAPLGLSLRPDTDLDGLDDEAEFIIGTNALNNDTDADGILDGAEIAQGLNPLDGLIAATGIIASVDTPGTAVDVAAFNDAVVIADSGNGISVFNVFNGMDPLIISQVDTPGSAQAVALSVNDSGSFVAVADGNAGLAIIDFTDPPSASIVAQLNLGSEARAVAVAGSFAYVGLSSGQVVVVDLIGQKELSRFTGVSGSIDDLRVGGDYLYALTDGTLITFLMEGADLIQKSSVSITGGRGVRRHRLFVGTDLLYARYSRGYNIISLSDPANPVLVRTESTVQNDWKQIVANGSGLGIAAVSLNTSGPHHIDIYDLGEDGTESNYLTTFQTPGLAAAVTLYNGIAYVADSTAGLQVINYLNFDALGVAPTINLETSATVDNKAEEGKLFRMTAEVSDDVQVRNVEFYVDGVLVATDGNFPFEYRFVTPLIENQLTFRVQARASDTGGNAAFSDERVITLTPDATPPRLISRLPLFSATGGGLSEVAAFFNEPMAAASFIPENFFIEAAGVDGILGTADDVLLSGLSLAYREESNGAFLSQASDFVPGKYRVTVRDVTDLIGNALATPKTWTFVVYDVGIDTDGDGVPDDVEALLGLDPLDSDSDDDGILDGLEDFDGDGLVNFAEVILGVDPINEDSDGNGILDGDEDADFDGLLDGDEFAQGTDPFLVDSDGDGFDDFNEILEGFDPTSALSRPLAVVFTESPSYLNAALVDFPETTPISVQSALPSYLNAALTEFPETTPILIQSALPSYLNAAPTEFPETTPILVQSALPSYLNGAPTIFPETTPILIQSALPSYLNAKETPFSGNVFDVSDMVSYENQ